MPCKSLIHRPGERIGQNCTVHVFSSIFLFLIEAAILRKDFMDHCDVLEQHFKALIPPNTIHVQFEDFLFINMKATQDMQGREFMNFVLQQSPDHVVYPDFLWYNSFNSINNYSLCQIIAVIPASSVDCERGFSALNLIKTNLRSKLRGD